MDLLSKQELTRSLLLPLRFAWILWELPFPYHLLLVVTFLPPFPFSSCHLFLCLSFGAWMINGLVSLNSSLRVSKSNFAPTCVLSASEAFFTSVSGWVSVTIWSFLLVIVLQPLISTRCRFWTCFSWWFAIAWAACRFTDDESWTSLKISCTLFLKVAFCQDVSSVSGRWMWFRMPLWAEGPTLARTLFLHH